MVDPTIPVNLIKYLLNAYDAHKRQQQISTIVKKIDKLTDKLDKARLQKLHSSFVALDDALETENMETKKIRLKYAENALQEYTALDRYEKIGEHDGNYWMAQANFGLYLATTLRKDDRQAIKHLMRAFKADPRTARQEMCPEFYQKIFKPCCKEVDDWYHKSLEAINRNDFSNRVFWQQTGIVTLAGVGAIALVAAAMLQPQVSRSASFALKSGKGNLDEILNDITPEKFRAQEKEKLDQQLEYRIDEKCEEIADYIESNVSKFV